MALPINIEDLLNKNKVESDRIEFKKGWNPVSIYRSICAFANDIDNIGGGYILVGVEEENGVAKRPVCGLSDESLDKIHREILQYNQLIEPSYAPRLHRNYQEREPVEITIEPDRVSILSYSGPDRTISMQAIKEAKSLRSRRYRNRRLGEFLKELELTEGRATGIPTIQKALSENGSSLATIETDESRTYFLMDIPCHPDFVKNVLVDVQVECLDLKQVAIKISQLCPSYRLVVSQSDIEKLAQCLLRATTEVSGHDMLDGIDTTSYKQRKRKYLDQLITMGLVEMTKPDKPTASDQKYRCTTLGKQMIMGDRTIKS